MTDEQRKLVEDNMRLAYYIANKYKYPGYDREDLQQMALEALCRAAMRYSAERGRFAAFAGVVIRNAILHEFNRCKMHAPITNISLDAPVSGDVDVALGEVVPSDANEIERAEEMVLAKQAYAVALSALKPNKREMFSLWLDGKTQQQVAGIAGYSQTMVSRVVRAGLRAIERGMRC